MSAAAPSLVSPQAGGVGLPSYAGTHWSALHSRWHAGIYIDRDGPLTLSPLLFHSEAEAAHEYDESILYHRADNETFENVATNFPHSLASCESEGVVNALTHELTLASLKRACSTAAAAAPTASTSDTAAAVDVTRTSGGESKRTKSNVGRIAVGGRQKKRARKTVEVQLSAEAKPVAKKPRNAKNYDGVTWDGRTRKWIARINVEGVVHELGSFHSEVDAARVYDIYVDDHRLDNVRNFPAAMPIMIRVMSTLERLVTRIEVDDAAAAQRVVNGEATGDVLQPVRSEMVVNKKRKTSSATASAATAQEGTVSETSETVSVTSASFSRRARAIAIRWSDDDTRRFYENLRQCGTDFEMLAQLFPRRTRRHLKLKFKKEERGTSPCSYLI